MPNYSKSSKRWLREHFEDPFVKQAKKAGLRSRAAFKLEQIQARDKLFHPGMCIVDLGAAPGSWAQFLKRIVGTKGRIIAVDLLPIIPLEGVEFIQGDFTDEMVLTQLFTALNGQKADWVISDMAPNFSGIDSVDQPRLIALGETALQFAVQVLHGSGGFLVKTFQGEGFEEFLKQLKQSFKKVATRKPKASRSRSNEIYILARN